MYQMLIVALVILVSDDGVNPKSRFTYSFFLMNTYVLQAAFLNSNKFLYLLPNAHIN